MIHPMSGLKEFEKQLNALITWHSIDRGLFPKEELLNAPKFGFFIEEMRRAPVHFAKLKKAAATQNDDKIQSVSRNVFSRFGVRLLAGLETSRRAGDPLSGEAAEALAASINNVGSCAEKFSVSVEKTSTGKERTFHKFGPVRQSQQRVVSWILDALIPPSTFDFALPGRRSIHGAAEAIGKYALAGIRYWVVTDITSAFPAVSAKHIRAIVSLDPALLSYVVFPHKSPTKQAVPPGLPTGGVHSSRFLSALVGRELQHLCCGNTVAIAHSDNIAIGAPTSDEAKCAHQALQDRMAHLKAGPLYLHETVNCDAYNHSGWCKTEGLLQQGAVEFCGYRTSVDVLTNQIRYRPSSLSFTRCRNKAPEKLKLVLDNEIEEAARGYVTRWANSFRLWMRIEDSKTYLDILADEIAHTEIMRRLHLEQ